MIENLPAYIALTFGLTVLLTSWFFLKAARYHRLACIIVVVWLIPQGIVGYSGFYTATNAVPPRLLLLALPPALLIAALFLTRKGRQFTDNLDQAWLTYLHVIRIPVEFVLLWLYLYQQVPRLMTFEGRNFDTLSGLTAPLVAYFGYNRHLLGRRVLLLWNLVCLVLLLNIVVHAVLSAPFAFQQLAFDQPNVAILYFPFVWLPGVVVPIVFYAHMAALRQLMNRNSLATQPRDKAG